MYDSKPIDAQHLKMLELLLMDPIIASAVRLDGVRSDVVIVQSDGSLRFQKSKYGWICKLFDYYKDMSFVDVTVRIASAITSNGTNRDDDSLVGIIKETVDKVLKENRKDEVIELLLAYTMFFNENSILRLRYKQDTPQPAKSGKGINLDGHGWMQCRVDLGSESFPAIVEFNTRKLELKLYVPFGWRHFSFCFHSSSIFNLTIMRKHFIGWLCLRIIYASDNVITITKQVDLEKKNRLSLRCERKHDEFLF